MKYIEQDLVQIKKTKSVEMYGNENEVQVSVIHGFGNLFLFIPMSKVFQVKRGLESYIQRFWRKRNVKKRV